MTNTLQKIIKDSLLDLPKESQEVINTFGWDSISKDIGEKSLLNENEINQLQVEIALILLGIVGEEFLSINIENRVGTSKNEAEKISKEINQTIFTPMLEKRDKLIKENLQIKEKSWDKRVDFIVSGGDYSVFVEK